MGWVAGNPREETEFARNRQPELPRRQPFCSVSKRIEAVEKPPRSSFWPLSRSVKSRFCSVLALDFRCFGAVSDYRPVQRRLFQQAGSFSETRIRTPASPIADVGRCK